MAILRQQPRKALAFARVASVLSDFRKASFALFLRRGVVSRLVVATAGVFSGRRRTQRSCSLEHEVVERWDVRNS